MKKQIMIAALAFAGITVSMSSAHAAGNPMAREVAKTGSDCPYADHNAGLVSEKPILPPQQQAAYQPATYVPGSR